jgi:cell division control protein 6
MVTQAKAVMHTSVAPGELKCREREHKEVMAAIHAALKHRKSSSMYVCGLPGTGKSLTVGEAEKAVRRWGDGSGRVGKLAKSERPIVAAVNCMALSEPRHVFARIIEALGGVSPAELARASADAGGNPENSDLSQLPEVATLRALVTGDGVHGVHGGGGKRFKGRANDAAKPMVVVLLDEMDQLASKAQSILYELFGLPTLPGSRCVVIGVANNINLVEVTLPRLKMRGCEPEVVRFDAYDKDQLKLLLAQRLAKLPWECFEDAGLELCSRKVASATGDMRRALNICAVAVDLCAREAAAAAAEAEAEAEGVATEKTPAEAARESKPLVRISHVARAISLSFASPVVDTMRSLPQQQQMVLCAAVRLFRVGGGASRSRETKLGELHDKYASLCKETAIKGMNSGQFSEVCAVLADQTLLRLGKGAEDRQRKVSLAVHEDDVTFALQGVKFFERLIGNCQVGRRDAAATRQGGSGR